MVIEQLLKQLREILPKLTPNSRDSSSLIAVIEGIFSNKGLDIEQRTNAVEAQLITAITTEKNTDTKRLYQLALKITLLNRGYYTDELGKLEKILLMLPYDKTPLNPSLNHPKYQIEKAQLWAFINTVRAKIGHCMDQPLSPADKIQALIKLIHRLTEKHQITSQDEVENQFHNQVKLAEIYKSFKLDYLKACLSKIRDNKVLTTDTEHSLWASASLESLYYLNYLNTDAFKKNVGGTETVRKDHYREQAELHRTRASYFIHCSQHLLEPIGFYVQYEFSQHFSATKFFSPRSRKTNTSLEDLESIRSQAMLASQTTSLTETQHITSALEILLAETPSPEQFGKALDLGSELEKRGNALGTLIKIAATTCFLPISKQRWDAYLLELQDIAIPNCWRFSVARLWLRLSDYFSKHDLDNHPHYKNCAFNCIDQVSERYGEQAHLMARLQRAKLCRAADQITFLEEKLSQITPDIRNQSPLSNEPMPYAKQTQYVFCKYKTQTRLASPHDTSPFIEGQLVDRYCELMAEDYPHGIELVVKLLTEETKESACAAEAVRKKYGDSYTNPIKLCQKVLKKKGFNGHLRIWVPLYRDANNNGFLKSQIEDWRKTGLNKDDIEYKLYHYVRSILYFVQYGEGELVPGGCPLLVDLDTELFIITDKLVNTIQRNLIEADQRGDIEAARSREVKATIRREIKPIVLFAHTYGKPGLLEAIFALLAYDEGNDSLAVQWSLRSIMSAPTATDRLSSPRQASGSDSSTAFNTPATSPELRRKASPRIRSFNTHSTQIGSPDAPARPTKIDRHPIVLKASDLSSSASSITEIPKAGSTDSQSSSSLGKLPFMNRKGPKSDRKAVSTLDLKNLRGSTQNTLSTSPPPKSPLSDSKLKQTVLTSEEEPSYLGYLILAQCLWRSRLKENPHRLQADITQFQDRLKDARQAKNKEELCYIKAMIWWNYFDSDNDPLWLTAEDKSTYEKTLASLSSTRFQSLGNNTRRQQYTVIKIIRSYLVRAMNSDNANNGSSDIYPPAAVAYEKHIWYWITDFYDRDTSLLNSYKRELQLKLKQAVEMDGYLPALYSKTQHEMRYLELFMDDGSLTEMYEFAHECYKLSERYIHIEQGQKFDFAEQIKAMKAKEAAITQSRERMNFELEKDESPIRQTIFKHLTGELPANFYLAPCASLNKKFNGWVNDLLAQRRADYLLEKRMPLEVALPNLPATLEYRKCMLTFGQSNENLNGLVISFSQLQTSPQSLNLLFKKGQIHYYNALNNMAKNGAEVIKLEDDDATLLNAWKSLKALINCFVLSEKYYREIKQVYFSVEEPILQFTAESVLVTHLDIAILGIITLLKGTNTIKEARDSQGEILIDFLREMAQLPASVWQCENTADRLIAFIEAEGLALAKKISQELSPGVQQLFFSPRNNTQKGSRSAINSPSGSVRLKPGTGHSSRISLSSLPRNHDSATPPSPRDAQNALDGDVQRRARSQTHGNLLTRKK